ncbi:class-III pyridoxal-phosphate-dependent aminotransferase [Qaidamihabitans albus]|uniref:class-III pyridoxal-phosphate-dependent aminotransferase n=1 Tax=Qaidamihabitans albus TaxID=2795733 RepID=UPI0018F16BF6|nr:aspartate aminotransferase family protein [Qaidamihabitans albus]
MDHVNSRLIYTGLNAGRKPLASVVAGHGVRFVLADGREVIDASNTGGPLGHGHPELMEAARRALEAPVINEGWAWAEREDAAQELIDVAFAGEGDWVGAMRFALSGSEANDLALSFAQAITGRRPLATRERAYHGMAGLARAMTVQPQWHGGLSTAGGGVRPSPPPAEVRTLPGPVSAAWGGTGATAPLPDRLSGAADTLDGVAAVIVDYTQGGVYYDGEYQDVVAGAAREAGALWIADEVVTGLGRQGRWFAFQGATSRPDIVTLGKPLGGGIAPAGAVVVSKDIVDLMSDKTWQTYSTFRGHPVAVAAARAHLRIVQRDGLVDRAAHLERLLEKNLVALAERHPGVARVDGRGMHWTVELHGPDWRTWDGTATGPPLASRVAARALDAGAMIGTSGEQSSLFLAPPLIIEEHELDKIFQALDHGLELADRECR